MKTAIIEDEKLTADRMRDILEQHFPTVEVVAILYSVAEAKEWFSNHPHPELVLMDIELGDGTSFDILNSISIQSRIIFTTAYDEYAIRAFKYNSIDYLLKPIDKNELGDALQKLNDSDSGTLEAREILQEIKRFFKKEYKQRFLVKSGEQLIPVKVEDVSYLFSEDGYSFLQLFSGKKYIMDKSLDELIEQLNPTEFFRLNRKYISSLHAIEKITPYFNARLQVTLSPDAKDKIVISRERVKPFKYWLDN